RREIRIQRPGHEGLGPPSRPRRRRPAGHRIQRQEQPMFVSDRIVFLELQKTGCTHIRNLLQELVGGELVGKHNRAGRELCSVDRFFLGSVRDPWEWYISLWAYGCDRKGVVFGTVTKRGRRIRGRGWSVDPIGAVRDLLRSRPNRNGEEWR